MLQVTFILIHFAASRFDARALCRQTKASKQLQLLMPRGQGALSDKKANKGTVRGSDVNPNGVQDALLQTTLDPWNLNSVATAGLHESSS